MGILFVTRVLDWITDWYIGIVMHFPCGDLKKTSKIRMWIRIQQWNHNTFNLYHVFVWYSHSLASKQGVGLRLCVILSSAAVSLCNLASLPKISPFLLPPPQFVHLTVTNNSFIFVIGEVSHQLALFFFFGALLPHDGASKLQIFLQ